MLLWCLEWIKGYRFNWIKTRICLFPQSVLLTWYTACPYWSLIIWFMHNMPIDAYSNYAKHASMQRLLFFLWLIRSWTYKLILGLLFKKEKTWLVENSATILCTIYRQLGYFVFPNHDRIPSNYQKQKKGHGKGGRKKGLLRPETLTLRAPLTRKP